MSVYLERLAMLADHMEHGELAHEEFSIHHYNAILDSSGDVDYKAMRDLGPKCGTVGCAIGECPRIWPEHFKWEGNMVTLIGSVDPDTGEEMIGMNAASEFFGINYNKTMDFFLVSGYETSNPTREDVAKKIRKYLA